MRMFAAILFHHFMIYPDDLCTFCRHIARLSPPCDILLLNSANILHCDFYWLLIRCFIADKMPMCWNNAYFRVQT